VGIKVVYSAIFLVHSAAIVHRFVAGLRDRPSRWTGPAVAAALTEAAVHVANRRRCPLTDVAARLGTAHGRVSDSFLPGWCADRIPQLCTPPLLVGVLGLAFHTWHHAACRHGSHQQARWTSLPRGWTGLLPAFERNERCSWKRHSTQFGSRYAIRIGHSTG
jgi:hypothetical protein